MCLELVGSAIALHQEGGVVLVLLGCTHFLTTDHLIQINEAVRCVCVCVCGWGGGGGGGLKYGPFSIL